MAVDAGDKYSKKLGMTPNQWKKMIEDMKKKPHGWGTGTFPYQKVQNRRKRNSRKA